MGMYHGHTEYIGYVMTHELAGQVFGEDLKDFVMDCMESFWDDHGVPNLNRDYDMYEKTYSFGLEIGYSYGDEYHRDPIRVLLHYMDEDEKPREGVVEKLCLEVHDDLTQHFEKYLKQLQKELDYEVSPALFQSYVDKWKSAVDKWPKPKVFTVPTWG